MMVIIDLDNTHHLIQIKKKIILVMRTLRVKSLKNFQMYHTVMLTIGIELNITFLVFLYLITENLFILTTFL